MLDALAYLAQDAAAVAGEAAWLVALNSLLNFLQVVILAYLAGQAQRGSSERNRQREKDGIDT